MRGGEATSGDGKPQSIDKKQAEKFQRGMVARVKRAPAADEGAEGGRLSPSSPKGSPWGTDADFELKVDKDTAPELLALDSHFRSVPGQEQLKKIQQHM